MSVAAEGTPGAAEVVPEVDPQGETDADILFGTSSFGSVPGSEIERAAAASAAAEVAGQQPAPVEGTAADGGKPAESAAGDGQQPVVPAADAAAAAAAATAAGATAPVVDPTAVEHAELLPQLGDATAGIEKAYNDAHHMAALTASREEHGKYFDLVQQHPRRLVGAKVPAVGNEPGQDNDGFITLADEADAKSWQDAVKTVLVEDVASKAAVIAENSRGSLEVIHSSIEMFQKNADLHPKSKAFDKELADALATTLKPYEMRKDGKLQGYAVPTQPLIDQLRTQLAASRAAAAASQTQAGAQGGAQQQASTAAAGDGPQAGVASKAGTSGGGGSDEADVLFGTFSHQTGSYTF